jgi:hypothetical protein
MKRTILSCILVISFLGLLSSAGVPFADFGFDYEPNPTELIRALVVESATTNGNIVNYEFSIDSKKLPPWEEIMTAKHLPALVKSFVIPSQTAKIELQSMTIESYTIDGTFIEKQINIDPKLIYIEKEFTFREARGYSVFIDLFTIENDKVFVVTSASFTLIGSGYFDLPTEMSEAFACSYRGLFTNFDSSYLVDLNFQKPSMLILSHTAIDTSPNFITYVRWKRQLGFDIHIIYKGDTGESNPTAARLRELVKEKYDDLEIKPDYLLLVGGSRDGNPFRIPTFFAQSPTGSIDATDMQYGIMSDTDFFPDMLVGRVSVDTANLVNNFFWKTRYYEMSTRANVNNWMDRATIVAGNFAAGNIPITPVIMSRWIAEKLRNIGMTTTEILWDETHDVGNGGTTQMIVSALNGGSSLVTYRGWGNAGGWEKPNFFRPELSTTNNGGSFPVVYSIVCGTGNFNHSTTNPSFGEAWMNMGTSSQPNGAIGYVGPTYLHTSTEYNNSIGSGMIWSIVHQHSRIFGATVMRGRIELYNNFPRELGNTGTIQFYWRTYNMISDPSLNLWIGAPGTMSVTLPTSVSSIENSLVLNIPNIDRGHATATRNNVDFTYARIVNGQAILPLPNSDTGNTYRVTISARNMRHVERDITITPESAIGMINHEITNGHFMSGQTAQVTITLKNFGTTAVSDVSGTLTSSSDFITNIINPSAVSIPAEGTQTLVFSISLAHGCPDDIDIPFNLLISPTDHNAKFAMVAGGYVLPIKNAIPQNTLNNIGPGETGYVKLTIENAKNAAVTDIAGTVYSLSPAVTIPDPTITFGNIAANGTAEATFSMTVSPDCFKGRLAHFYVEFEKDSTVIARSHFSLTLGLVTNTSPTGPDRYGYYAYDSSDIDYPGLFPVYDWVEINPNEGGQGNIIYLSDDKTQTVDFPTGFSFRFYGQDFTQLSINDNGWVAFGETIHTDFRNWNIPAALGPKNMLAVFWDDLKGALIPDTSNPIEYVDMEIKYWHDAVNNRFVVTWDDVFFSQDVAQAQGIIKFQVILEPRLDEAGEITDGDIIYQYKRILNFSQNTNFATIGIQNADHTDGLCYSFSNFYADSATELHDGLAIRFTTRPPDNYHVATIDHVTPHSPVTLHQNYPNPFNPTTVIKFTVNAGVNGLLDSELARSVSIDIFNIKGQLVRNLVNEIFVDGEHSVAWNGKDDNGFDVASGIYFYRIESQGFSQTHKMVLMK